MEVCWSKMEFFDAVRLDSSQDWTYLAEGKMHIVLENTFDVHCFGKVLRISKESGIMKVVDYTNTYDDLIFIENNLKEWFSSSALNCTILLQANEDFLTKVTSAIKPCRPSGRSKDIILQSSCFLENHLNWVSGSSQIADCTIELKVKCGLFSDSPFVPDDRTIKLRYTRYKLMQLYKMAKQHMSSSSQPEWGTFYQVSDYCPRDLCSKDPERINHALVSLFANPQNNLKLTVKGHHLYGWDSVCKLEDLKARLLEEGSDISDVDEVMLVLSSILSVENTLEKLEQLQRLDVLDVEGADAVFKRLEVLTAGRQGAVDLLVKELLLPLDLSLVNYLLRWGHNSKHSDDSVYAIVDKLLQWRIQESTSPEERLTRLSMALQLTQSMSAAECVQLLKLWMVSLIARDASVIVSFEKCDSVTLSDEYQSVSPSSSCCLVKPQSESGPGVVVVMLAPTAASTPAASPLSVDFQREQPQQQQRCFRYSLTLVDVGLKAMDKLWNKNDEEGKICSLCAKYEQSL